VPYIVLAATLLAAAFTLAACSNGVSVSTVPPATVAAARTQVAPSVQAAATAVSSAAQSTATAVAPTVVSAQTAVGSAVQGTATGVAPTVAAAQTQTVSTVQTAATAVGSAVQGTATGVAPTVVAAQTQTVSTAQTAATAVGSAVQGTATGVAPSVVAAQTAIAPTVIAAQTQVAPTRNALATQAVATFGPPIATSTTASLIQISAATISQGDTTVTLRNSGTIPINVSAWMLLTGNTTVILPVDPALLVQPNAALTLHFASGANTATDYYLGQVSQAFASTVKPGDRLVLVNLSGQIVSIYQLS
jgi:hypothetical protein